MTGGVNERRNFTYSSKDRSHRYLRNHCRGPQRDERLNPPQTERERIRERDSAKYLILEIEKRKKNNPLNAFSDFQIGGEEESGGSSIQEEKTFSKLLLIYLIERKDERGGEII